MEQQCKSDGLHLRNRDVVDEDRISELHEALLVNILSLLPTKSVIATSVLSKRWRHVWKMVQNLKFDSKYHRKFSEDVYRLFNFHKAPFLESLRLKLRDKRDALDVEILIGIAFARHVRKLVLDLDYVLDNNEEGSMRFPSVLCSCDNNTLETLKLKHPAIHLYFPSRVCLKSLRNLHLYHVDFRDDNSVCNLLCGCPSLEDLVVHRDSRYDGVWTFTIAVPSLQRLTLEDECHGTIDGGYLINAPALKNLHINMLNPIDFCLIEKMPELVEARISDAFDVTTENILESLTSVKRLSLLISPLSFSLEINVPTGQIFDQLVYLELRTHEIIWWTLLPLMLDSSPNLQILKLITDLYSCGEVKNPDEQKWNPPECVPECLLFHLETFVWIGYEWQREYEKVATYILKNARQLKKATFSTKHIKPGNLEKLEKRREMLDELASVVRASDSCHLVFESY